jgi:hypothetical protein
MAVVEQDVAEVRQLRFFALPLAIELRIGVGRRRPLARDPRRKAN